MDAKNTYTNVHLYGCDPWTVATVTPPDSQKDTKQTDQQFSPSVS